MPWPTGALCPPSSSSVRRCSCATTIPTSRIHTHAGPHHCHTARHSYVSRCWQEPIAGWEAGGSHRRRCPRQHMEILPSPAITGSHAPWGLPALAGHTSTLALSYRHRLCSHSISTASHHMLSHHTVHARMVRHTLPAWRGHAAVGEAATLRDPCSFTTRPTPFERRASHAAPSRGQQIYGHHRSLHATARHAHGTGTGTG